MSKLVVIGGDSSTGKSTACGKVELPKMGIDIIGLDPKETFLFNVMENKPLTSKWMSDSYNKENKNILESSNYNTIKAYITKIAGGKKFKNIIIDDFQYLMSLDYFSKKDISGFQKFAVMGFAVVDLVLQAMKTREDLVIFILTHTDDEVDVKGNKKVKLKTIGKMLDDTFKLNGMFTLILEAYKKKSKGKLLYRFKVRASNEHDIAKAPIDMFIEDGEHIMEIPNDLGLVEREVRRTYNI